MTWRCADTADARHLSLAGTASRADKFVLIETPAPWPVKALEVIDPTRREGLAAAAETHRAKILLIRRPGQRVGEQRLWAVVDVRRRAIRWGSLAEDFSGIDEALAGQGEWSTDPIVLVCAHARHDPCCGLRGRPVAHALAESHPELVWESSHVGGHRFAGNLVVPLDGTYYGRIDAEGAAAIVVAHFRAEVPVEHLRGFSWMHPSAQVVATEALRRWGPAGADEITRADATETSPGRWQVEIEGSQKVPALVTAEVVETLGEPVALSCGAAPEPTTTYQVTFLDVG